MKLTSRLDVEVRTGLVKFDVYCLMFIAIVSLVILQTDNTTNQYINMSVCRLTDSTRISKRCLPRY